MPTDWSDDIVLAELAEEPEFSEELSAIFARISPTPSDSAPAAAAGSGSSAATPPGQQANAATSQQAPNVVLNFQGVNFLNSSHIAQLLRLRKQLQERGKRLVLCSLSDELWSVMLLTGLDKVFVFAPDPMTALASIQIEH